MITNDMLVCDVACVILQAPGWEAKPPELCSECSGEQFQTPVRH